MMYSKTIKIKNKCFKKDDILQLAKSVEAEFSEDDYQHCFTVDFWDDSSISDISSQIFNCTSFNRKRVKKIYIEYISQDYSKTIDIMLLDSSYLDDSDIEIQSNEQFWYEAMISRFSDIINDIENQRFFAPLLQSSYFYLFAVSIITFALTLACGYPVINIVNGQGIILPISMQLDIVLLIILINLILCIIAGKHLKKAFPTIDFNFGPEHMNQSLKNRKAITWCTSTLFPSIILNIIDRLF